MNIQSQVCYALSQPIMFSSAQYFIMHGNMALVFRLLVQHKPPDNHDNPANSGKLVYCIHFSV